MIKITIDAKLVRAAMANQANQDVRYYLNGILLTTQREIVGTNGNTLFYSPDAWEQDEDNTGIDDDIIVNIEGTIPVGAKTVTFELTALDLGVDQYRGYATTDKGKVLAVTTMDGKYPDFNRVLPDTKRPANDPGDVIGFNAGLLGKVEKTFGKDTNVKFHFRGPTNAVRIEALCFEGAIMVLMPTRL